MHWGLQVPPEWNSCSFSAFPADNFNFCVTTGGRVLFAGTDTGCITAHKHPLNGEILFFFFFYADFFFCVCTGGRVLFAGMDTGCIRAFKYPLNGEVLFFFFFYADFFFCVCTGGRVLFAGTDTGCIRAYKYPLNGEFQEFRCCGSAITQLMLTYDDAVLFASGQDGSLFVFDVKDKDPTRVVTKRCVLHAVRGKPLAVSMIALCAIMISDKTVVLVRT